MSTACERPVAESDAWFWAHDIRPDQLDSVVMPGWRLRRLSSYGQGGERRLAALLDQRRGPARGYWLDLDAATMAARLAGTGIRPVAITAHQDQARFCLVFETATTPTSTVHVGLDEAGLRALVDGQHGVIDLATYLAGDTRRYTAITETSTGRSSLLLGVDPAELGAELRGRDLTPRCLRAYRDADRPRLAVVAVPTNGDMTGDTNGTTWSADLDGDQVASTLERHAARPLDLDAIRDDHRVRFTLIMRRDDGEARP